MSPQIKYLYISILSKDYFKKNQIVRTLPTTRGLHLTMSYGIPKSLQIMNTKTISTGEQIHFQGNPKTLILEANKWTEE